MVRNRTVNDMNEAIEFVKKDFTELVTDFFNVGNNEKYPDETINSFMHGNCGLFAICAGMVLRHRYGYNVEVYDNDYHTWLVVSDDIVKDEYVNYTNEAEVDFEDNTLINDDIRIYRKYLPDKFMDSIPTLTTFEMLTIDHLGIFDAKAGFFIKSFLNRHSVILNGIMLSYINTLQRGDDKSEFKEFDIIRIDELTITENITVNSLTALKDFNKITICENVCLTIDRVNMDTIQYVGSCVIYPNDFTFKTVNDFTDMVNTMHGRNCSRVKTYALPNVKLDFKAITNK